ncbi:MAG: septum formation protein Maf [Alphaproteobacteria bacterium]|nr:septum formation protein Maf [Alphaproteobacteria bacterium]
MSVSAEPSSPPVILASASASRAQILSAAGVAHEIVLANVDEGEVKRSLAQEGAPAFAVAETLAELKAQKVSRRHRGALVIGADQVLECGGQLFDKPPDLDHARAHLTALRGRRHTLVGSVSVVRDGAVLWHLNDQAHLEMRDLSDAFIEWYIEQMGEPICDTVGAYKLEGLGAQLFDKIEGDFFSILGLPLLPLLAVLRNHGVVRA